jgi:hypothetical protein
MMDGEYGNIEFWIANHTWTDSANRSEVCRLYGKETVLLPCYFVLEADIKYQQDRLGKNIGKPGQAQNKHRKS